MTEVAVGRTLGSYRVLEKLGEGGMGIVYLAEHALIGRRAVIKLLRPEISRDQEIVRRFFNEARSTGLIKHPGLVDIFDFGYDTDGRAFIVMEHLSGESLAGRLRREGRLAPATILVVARQIAGAVGAAHARGIVHRDLKPDNVFLVPDRDVAGGVRVKILDFGIAKLLGDGGAGPQTQTGAVIGTPLYMSPEQCRGRGEVDARSDVYALGCILYELACGQPPFVSSGMGEIIAAHIYETPVPPRTRCPTLPPSLDAVITKALAKAPDDRFSSMEALAAALDGVEPADTALAVTAAGDVQPAAAGAVPDTKVRTPAALAATTLGAAAGERATDARRGARWPAVAAVVALLAATGVGAFLAGREGERSDQGAAPPPSGPASGPEPTATTTPPPAAVLVTLTIETEPSGADVFRVADGVRIGRTPYQGRIARIDGEALFLVKLGGYADHYVTLPADRDGAERATLVPLVADAGADAVAAAGRRPGKPDKAPRPGTPPPEAPVDAGPAAVAAPKAPGADARTVAATIQRHRGQVSRCYQERLKREPGLAGRVTVTFTLLPEGKPTRVRADGFDPAIDRCIEKAVLGWRFEPFEGEAATFSFPFVLRAAE